MKKTLLCASLAMCSVFALAQDLKKFNLYRPAENAEQGINEAVMKAKAEKKHVFIQIGGNWCIWCARFNNFITTDSAVDSLVSKNYVVYHLNYSSENKNDKLLEKYSFPQRFGFPVFLILDQEGKLLHTQNSAYLEDGGKSYKKDAVIGFFRDWSPAAFDPNQYKDQ